jgi:UAA transporter family
MSLPGFKVSCTEDPPAVIGNFPYYDPQVGIFLGYLEVLGVTFCAFIERSVQGETTRKSTWSAYSMLCFCLLISSATSNIALAYINYPTKVVFRSCKVNDLHII